MPYKFTGIRDFDRALHAARQGENVRIAGTYRPGFIYVIEHDTMISEPATMRIKLSDQAAEQATKTLYADPSLGEVSFDI
ncbi:MAG: hypothetical protein HYU56_02790 [Candidatus Aenigmarchaeota archaeon]|nr:hypothetical protein [Candidatus Aenigmarchaeota archaeon]